VNELPEETRFDVKEEELLAKMLETHALYRPITLRFRAENFEAVATRVGTVESSSYWTIRVGAEVPYTLLTGTIGLTPESGWSASVLTGHNGWKTLIGYIGSDEIDLLALAISLLYSVPGVEVVTEAPAVCSMCAGTGITRTLSELSGQRVCDCRLAQAMGAQR
jgi:hypothetical protein